jgi:phosphoglycolate phosphatase
MKFKAVIFDLDGTLLDTIEDLTESMNRALFLMGYPGRTIEECKQLVGDGIDVYVQRALPPEARNNSEIADRLKKLMKSEYQRRGELSTKPYDGIAELLDALTRSHIGLAILSNKPHDSTLRVTRKFLTKWAFQAILGARDKVPVKPDPTAALEIAHLLNLPPAEILYLGDTNTDMRTANAAGMYAVGALWGFRTAEELIASGAKVLVSKPPELLTLFDECQRIK